MNEPTVKTLHCVFLTLLILLALTVWVSVTPLASGLATSISLMIAAAKAILVLFFFMKLKYEIPTLKFFAFGGFVWAILLTGLLLTEYLSRGTIGVLGK